MKRFIVTFLAALPILAVSWYDCEWIPWTSENKTCNAGYNEVYRDEYGDQFHRVCCLANSGGETTFKRSAPNCRATECVAPSEGSLCPNLYRRILNGRELEYEEVMREPCIRDGGQGMVGLCCQPNSQEGVLLTTLGAEHNEFPHQARLVPGCGGTIYNKRFIITASHCVVHGGRVDPAQNMKVFLGTNIGEMDDSAQDYLYKVKRVIPHEGYNRLASNPKNELDWPAEKLRFYNDIALLELERDIQFTDNVKALEIAPANFDPFLYADNAVIIGWGTTETLAQSVHLQKGNVILRRDERCFQVWVNNAEFKDSTLCVGGILDGKYSWSAGEGDSGGPAICRNAEGNPVLCGVTSFGAASDEACEKNSDEASCPPSAYSEVAYYRDWIRGYAGEQNSSTFYQPYLYGKEVQASDYPHQVRITDTDVNGKIVKSCGGTLVQPNVVVTAAQCVVKDDGYSRRSGLAVRHGNGETFGVTSVKPLTGFEMEETKGNHNTKIVFYKDNYYKNDLAVIKLDGSVPVSQRSLPRLPTNRDTYDRGTELAYPSDTTGSAKLRSRDFKILERSECEKRMSRIGGHTGRSITLDKNLMCGVERYSGGSTCDRELGGGLICPGPDKEDVLCGVQTFRLCTLSLPNGFIDLRQHGEWVQNRMGSM